MALSDDALSYHGGEKPGKLEIRATKPLSTQYDLSLAYSPGVAEPCRVIAANPDASFAYTARANLVAVITDGSAVLGLGDIGPAAAKPVMEGKAVLFKRFAGVDSIDIEITRTSIDQFVETVASMEPSFGGINLEDIKSPECFEIERRLKERLEIPVMHDDQHGTAIIVGAALINALAIADKRLVEVRIVIVGAGAAAIACSRFFLLLGVKRKNLVLFDKDGLVHEGRRDLAAEIAPFARAATETNKLSSIGAALAGADVMLGLSAGGILSAEDIAGMATNPAILALANPDPEIDPAVARATRPDAIIATGRSDTPNQVNNVLGFPFIFRGALDVGAREINDEMKIAAAEAIASLAREPVPDAVNRMYSDTGLTFGREYILPKPLDPRLVTTIAPAVAQAAITTGVARTSIADRPEYEAQLLERVGMGQKLVTAVIARARRRPKRVAYPEAADYEVLKAAEMAAAQGIAHPVLIGNAAEVKALIEHHGLSSLGDAPLLDPGVHDERRRAFADAFHERRRRRGVTIDLAYRLMGEPDYYATELVAAGEVDAIVSGRTRPYPQVLRPALQAIGTGDHVDHVAGLYVVNTRRGTFFFADTTVNVDPTVETFLDIIALTVDRVRDFDIEPVVALLSYSNFGSARGPLSSRIAEVAARAREHFPDVVIDGEIQANVALDPELLATNYPFSALAGRRVNTLIFPNLSSGNIAYKLLEQLGGGELIGPVLSGLKRPVQILQMGASAREILQMTAIAVLDAQRHESTPT